MIFHVLQWLTVLFIIFNSDNPNLEQVCESYKMYRVTDSEVDILSFIQKKTESQECNLKHIYRQCDVNQLLDGVKFMARDEVYCYNAPFMSFSRKYFNH